MREKIGVIFGGRSVEHEISILTAYQAIEALDKSKFTPIPIYIRRDGRWFYVNSLRLSDFKKQYPSLQKKRQFWTKSLFTKELAGLDVAMPLIHGTYGEDGTLQGLLELADIPYVGSGVMSSALGMDKVIMKAVFRGLGLPVVDYCWVKKAEWKEEGEAVIERIEQKIPYPLFVKPANLGSSIGINKAGSREDLVFALDVASSYDLKMIVEKAVSPVVEINCAVLGEKKPIASVCEQPVSWKTFLDYDDKYATGGKAKGMKGLARKVPAEIPEEMAKRIQDMAITAFFGLDCRGVARIDFLVKQDQIYINEINTIPGSLSFYLWQKPMGITFTELLNRLIALAKEVYQEKKKLIYEYKGKIF
ncbi:MAG: D-alanine--D-alanine ligase family protein [bacterium]|nr:D-alanine--D-alanine ligase family protein [bacterium]